MPAVSTQTVRVRYDEFTFDLPINGPRMSLDEAVFRGVIPPVLAKRWREAPSQVATV